MNPRLPYQDPELSPEQRTADLLSRMTLEDKVGQLVQADGRRNARAQVEQRRVGSFLHVLGETTIELQRLAERTGHGIPLLFGIDAIHGHGFWRGATVFPSQLALSCSWNPQLVETMARVTAKEMACTGLHWTFSPVLCLTRDLRWGRVGETFGEDPHLIGVLGQAAVRGYQGTDLSAPDSVLACAKHYAGYSETVGGRDAAEAEISRRKLRSDFLPPFRAAVEAGCRTVMTAYQCIDGVNCSVNRWLLTDLLRDEWGFDGFVVTDWDNVGRAWREQKLYPSIEAVVPHAIRAGNDMIMATPEFYEAALKQVRAGQLDVADIERACRRVLRHKFELGLFDHKRYPAFDHAATVVGCAEHRATLLPAALQSIVLLKNGPAGTGRLLPLGPQLKRIAVLGPNADDPRVQLGDWSLGSGQVCGTEADHPRHLVTTILDGIRARAEPDGITVEYAAGCEVLRSDLSQVEAAAAIAAAADIAIVVVGDVLEQIGEGCDRCELELTGGQMPLLQAVKAARTPLVVVLVNSKPLCIPWVADHADAIVEAFNPGMAGGTAVAKILFGDENPCGKLTVSFPTAIGQQPVYYSQIPGWHGSRHGNYDPSPLFCFGHGLSYTQYGYRNLRLEQTELGSTDPVIAEVEVTNRGDRAGIEIVQLYLNDLFTTLSTPSKVLKAHQRVALDPGQTRSVRFELPHACLGFVGSDEQPVVEPGEFELMVGPSSRDEHLLRARFRVVG